MHQVLVALVACAQENHLAAGAGQERHWRARLPDGGGELLQGQDAHVLVLPAQEDEVRSQDSSLAPD